MAVDREVEEALRLENLQLPEFPHVVAVLAEPYEDVDGNEALRVNVILDDNTTDDQITGGNVLEIKTHIREQLRSRGVRLFPYIFLATRGEFAEETSGEE